MDFNIRLKNIRKRNRITQKDIAEYLGINTRTYQRYEDGSVEPPLSNVMSIANYFKLPIDCLLGNGLFSNWEEILLHKDEILSYLKNNIISSPDLYDLYALTEKQLAYILPAFFTKIIIENSTIYFFHLIPIVSSACPLSGHVDDT